MRQDDLQHVHAEAATRLLAVALRQVSGVVRGVHHLHGEPPVHIPLAHVNVCLRPRLFCICGVVLGLDFLP